ncbi:MAG: hypothetical protein Q9171_001470 [Xanthocarpia ochracea]
MKGYKDLMDIFSLEELVPGPLSQDIPKRRPPIKASPRVLRPAVRPILVESLPPESSFTGVAVGELDLGELEFEELNVGGLAVGELDPRELDFEEFKVGGLAVGELDAGELAVRELDVGDRGVGELDVDNDDKELVPVVLEDETVVGYSGIIVSRLAESRLK